MIKRYLELALKSFAKAGIVLAGSQWTVNNGNQCNMSLDSVEVPKLILVQAFILAFLVIDFHRPAITTFPCDVSSPPYQAVADIKSRVVG